MTALLEAAGFIKAEMNSRTAIWYPSVDDFGILAWPNREEIEPLLVMSRG